jgi:L-fuconolactonase
LDHIGAPLAVGLYKDRRQEVFGDWKRAISELATCKNVHVKIGGLNMRFLGLNSYRADVPPSSKELAQIWQPYVECCIDAFGTKRCMFESNFPVDKCSCSYHVLWNAFKRLASGYSSDERDELFFKTAATLYRLDMD